MKKYKLIQIYPKSPPIGTEIVLSTIYNYCKNEDCNIQRKTYMREGREDFELENPWDYPKNWEEIVEYPIGTKAVDNRIKKTFIKKADGWYNSNKTAHTDKSINDARWIDIVEDEKVDKNPLKLEVGKSYKLQYKHCVSPIRIVKITRITPDGFPWMECDDYKGIVSPDCYNLIEEIIEKDYEILSFITNMKVVFDINDDKTYSHRKHIRYSLKEMLEDDGLKIYSVKRLSDGEVFTVGDEITYEVITTGKNRIISSKINKFYIDLNNKLRINFDLDRENINTNCYLKDAVKSKVLFRTEEYILMNKPCLSINELIALSVSNTLVSNKLRDLKNLVKNKIDGN